MATSIYSPTGDTLNFRVTYSYSDYKGNGHKNFIDINGKSEPSPSKVVACVAARWRKKRYSEGIFESIQIESIE